jgi:hypothetical protein
LSRCWPSHLFKLLSRDTKKKKNLCGCCCCCCRSILFIYSPRSFGFCVSSLSLVSLCNALLVVDLLLVVCLIKVVNVWWEMTLVGNNDPRFSLSWPIGSRFFTLEVTPVRLTRGLLPSESPLIVSFWLFSRKMSQQQQQPERLDGILLNVPTNGPYPQWHRLFSHCATPVHARVVSRSDFSCKCSYSNQKENDDSTY